MNQYKALYFLCALFLLQSCTKLLMDDDPENTNVQNFDLLWENIDKRYSFFEFKNIDWDHLRTRYRPQAQAAQNDRELFEVLDEMLFELRDGHVNLTSPFNTSRNWNWRLNSPPNFNSNIMERTYLGSDHYITGPFRNQKINNILYVYYGSFSQGFSDSQLNFLFGQNQNAQAVIFDVRNNGGGSLSHVTRIVNYFAEEQTPAGYNIFKAGPGHSDFTSPIPQYSEPGEDVTPFTKPVVLLTNRGCYSATTDFVRKMRVLPQVTVMGDTTGGGGGLPFSGELPNGWTYRFSTTQSFDHEGKNIEHGIAPDTLVYLKPEDEAQNKDTMIEAAIKLLNRKKE